MPKLFGEGQKYIQIDVDIHDNDKIEILREKFGDAGFTFFVLFCCRLFENSYYIELTDRVVAKFCKKVLKKSQEEFFEMLEFSFDIQLFNRHLYTQYKIVTSRGVQRRYLIMGRKWERIKFYQEYMLDEVSYENSTIVVYDLDNVCLYHKKKQCERVYEPFKKRDHVKKTVPEDNTKKPHSGIQPSQEFDNIESQEEIDIEKHLMFRDMELEELSCAFFNYSEQSNFDKFRIFTFFLGALKFRGELEEFRKQFPFYIKYKKISGEKIPYFKNFIGDQSEQFSNGLWNEENWKAKFDNELSKPIGQNGHNKVVESKSEQAISGHENFVKQFKQT